MAVSPTLAREHTVGLIFLLENLGFIINHPKSHLTPTQEIDFLGFVVNSNAMEIRQDTRRLLETPQPPALMISRLLGKLKPYLQPPSFTGTSSFVCKGHWRGQLGGRDYTQLTPAAIEELQRWQEHLTRWNGRYQLG